MADVKNHKIGETGRMEWWREARFGMFIHWGLYSSLSGEWKGRRSRFFPAEWIMREMMIPKREYRKLAGGFNPVKFDARRWVEIAKNAGMKYIVVTSKHHEGFSMFRTRKSSYNIVEATPFGRDPLKELSAACAEAGLRLGVYYSQLDWNWSPLPLALGPVRGFAKYLDFIKGQLEELLTNYGPVSVLFFDGDWMLQWTEAVGREVEAFCRRLQPDIVINNRVGKRMPLANLYVGNILVSELIPALGEKAMEKKAGDYVTPEQFIPAQADAIDWETNMTMNRSWGYSKFDNDWKSGPEMVRMLLDIISKGGNFLMNVGPDADGVIPEPSVERLAEIGRWMKTNGEAVYGCGRWRESPGNPQIRYTAKGTTLYASCFERPAGELILKSAGILGSPRVELLGARGAKLKSRRKGGTLAVDVANMTYGNLLEGYPVVFKID